MMLRQLIRRLHEAETAGHGQYAVCVTGDHSTPVLFGDHSHEPVPFTIAHVRHVVSIFHICYDGSRVAPYKAVVCLAWL